MDRWRQLNFIEIAITAAGRGHPESASLVGRCTRRIYCIPQTWYTRNRFKELTYLQLKDGIHSKLKLQ